jgi:hypothetical protein
MTQGRKDAECNEGEGGGLPQRGKPQAQKNPAEPGFFACSGEPEREFGAQKRTRTSTPFRVPAPEAGASTNSAIWATESDVEGAPSGVNRLFEVFATAWRKPHAAQNISRFA